MIFTDVVMPIKGLYANYKGFRICPEADEYIVDLLEIHPTGVLENSKNMLYKVYTGRNEEIRWSYRNWEDLVQIDPCVVGCTVDSKQSHDKRYRIYKCIKIKIHDIEDKGYGNKPVIECLTDKWKEDKRYIVEVVGFVNIKDILKNTAMVGVIKRKIHQWYHLEEFSDDIKKVILGEVTDNEDGVHSMLCDGPYEFWVDDDSYWDIRLPSKTGIGTDGTYINYPIVRKYLIELHKHFPDW